MKSLGALRRLKKILRRQINADSASPSHQFLLSIGRDKTAGAASVCGVFPFMDARHIKIERIRYLFGTAAFVDNATGDGLLRVVHVAHVATIATDCQ